LVNGCHHLETDASLNLKNTKPDDEGRPLWLAGGGIVVRSPEMKPLGWEAIPLGYVRSTEQAEGLALLEGMRQAREKFGATQLRARSDNYLLVQHVNRHYKISEGYIQGMVTKIWSEAQNFARFKLLWAPSSHVWFRSDLTPSADTLARSAAGLELRGVKGTAQRAFRTLPR
jgi:ribonuclease HI